MNRRRLLLAGSSSVVVVTSGTTVRLEQQRLARGSAASGVDTDAPLDPRLKALTHAILAASPHNG